MLGDLGVSTLRLIKTTPYFSSLFGASNQPCCLLQCLGTTLRVRLRRPLAFFIVLGNPFLITSLLDLLSLFLDHHTGHPARHDAWILLMSASSMPSEFFHRRFDLLEVCFL
jgi:hypothetical protein